MQALSQIRALVLKDFRIDFRNKYALAGLLMYTISTVAVIYFSLQYQSALGQVKSSVWNTFFWMVVLFTAVNAVARSFTEDMEKQQFYYYPVVSPQVYISAKIIYNVVIMLVLSLISYLFFSFFLGSKVGDMPLFIATIVLGAMGFGTLFTLITAIAAKAGNNSTLAAILGFPLIIPLIIFILKLSKESFVNSHTGMAMEKLLTVAAFDILLFAMAVVLFPYIWRD